MTNTIAKSREHLAFAVEESTKGTLAYPTLAAELLVLTAQVDLKQPGSFSDSKEIADTLDTLDRFRDQTGAGTFSLNFYNRPVSKGVAPMGDILFESLQGGKAVVGTTSVTYAQSKIKKSFSIWFKRGHTCYFGSGACAETLKLALTNKGAVECDFGGGFMVKGWAGTSVTTAATSEAATVNVDNGKLFTVGALIQLAADTKTNAGYRILSIDDNELTLTESVSVATAAVVKGFIPAALVAVGSPVESLNNAIKFDGSPKILKSLTIDINSPVEWQNEEITTSGYVEAYVESKRSVKVSCDSLFREQDLEFFYNSLNNTKTAVIATIGKTAGSICTVNMPYTEFEEPSESAGENTVSLSLSGVCLGAIAGENSATIVFT